MKIVGQALFQKAPQGNETGYLRVSFNVFASRVQMADSLPDAAGRAWGGAA